MDRLDLLDVLAQHYYDVWRYEWINGEGHAIKNADLYVYNELVEFGMSKEKASSLTDELRGMVDARFEDFKQAGEDK